MNSIHNTNTPNEIVDDYMRFLYTEESGAVPFVKKERIKAHLNEYGEAINTLMVYPDILSDIMTPKGSAFKMFFEQRMVARAMIRYRQGFFTFTRGFSKSFLAFYIEYNTCMFIPRHRGFVVGGTKQQVAQIAREKVVDDLWVKFPLLAHEMQKFRRGGKLKAPFIDSGDHVEFRFSNGSIFDVLGGQVRGGRRHSGIFEEVITLDPIYINESVIPMLNTIRTTPMGSINPNEPQSKKIFITSAGWQGTFAYDKLVETLCLMMIDPTKYIIMGGSYKPLVMHGRLTEDTMREILSSPTWDADQVDREYRSIWSSAMTGAVFEPGNISNLRKIKNAETKARADIGNGFYVISVDLAYDGNADTAVIVGKITPGEYRFTYHFINMFTIDVVNYEIVANILKDTAEKYNAKLLVYDANGVGATLREHLNKISTYEKENGDLQIMPAYGILNPPEDVKDQLKVVHDKRYNICYEIKSGGQVASKIHGLFLGKMANGSVRLLIKSGEALRKFENIKNFAMASKPKKDRIMRPYYYTDLFEEELKNLDFKQDVTNDNIIKVVRRNENLQKDFFSAAEYLIYATVSEIELEYYKKKKIVSKKTYTFVTKNSSKYDAKDKAREARRNPRRRK